MLIVLRGNSGSGKSTTAKLLRDTAIQQGCKHKIAVVEQDYLRRIILKEKGSEGSDNLDLILQTVVFALERNYVVILEGILYSKRYKVMIEKLCEKSPMNYIYYFDVSFEETLKRHNQKPNAHEFGEKEMREWYKDKDLLGLPDEKVFSQILSQEQIVQQILTETKLV